MKFSYMMRSIFMATIVLYPAFLLLQAADVPTVKQKIDSICQRINQQLDIVEKAIMDKNLQPALANEINSRMYALLNAFAQIREQDKEKLRDMQYLCITAVVGRISDLINEPDLVKYTELYDTLSEAVSLLSPLVKETTFTYAKREAREFPMEEKESDAQLALEGLCAFIKSEVNNFYGNRELLQTPEGAERAINQLYNSVENRVMELKSFYGEALTRANDNCIRSAIDSLKKLNAQLGQFFEKVYPAGKNKIGDLVTELNSLTPSLWQRLPFTKKARAPYAPEIGKYGEYTEREEERKLQSGKVGEIGYTEIYVTIGSLDSVFKGSKEKNMYNAVAISVDKNLNGLTPEAQRIIKMVERKKTGILRRETLSDLIMDLYPVTINDTAKIRKPVVNTGDVFALPAQVGKNIQYIFLMVEPNKADEIELAGMYKQALMFAEMYKISRLAFENYSVIEAAIGIPTVKDYLNNFANEFLREIYFVINPKTASAQEKKDTLEKIWEQELTKTKLGKEVKSAKTLREKAAEAKKAREKAQVAGKGFFARWFGRKKVTAEEKPAVVGKPTEPTAVEKILRPQPTLPEALSDLAHALRGLRRAL